MQRRQQNLNHKLHEQHRTTKQMSIDNKQDEMRGLVDYNTDRDQLILPEYGRSIQNMVNHCMTIEDRAERQRCAETIVAIMAKMKNKSSDEAELKKKLWNHLAAIADYELDIDYPYEIEKMSDRSSDRQRIAYPQHPIGKRHYGAIIERGKSARRPRHTHQRQGQLPARRVETPQRQRDTERDPADAPRQEQEEEISVFKPIGANHELQLKTKVVLHTALLGHLK